MRLAQLAPQRAGAGAQMRVRPRLRAAAGRVPVVGEDLAAIGLLHGVQIASRPSLPLVATITPALGDETTALTEEDDVPTGAGRETADEPKLIGYRASIVDEYTGRDARDSLLDGAPEPLGRGTWCRSRDHGAAGAFCCRNSRWKARRMRRGSSSGSSYSPALYRRANS